MEKYSPAKRAEPQLNAMKFAIHNGVGEEHRGLLGAIDLVAAFQHCTRLVSKFKIFEIFSKLLQDNFWI